MPKYIKNQVKTLEKAHLLFNVYIDKGWEAFVGHPEASRESENVLILAVTNKKTDFALKILETTPQLSDSGRKVFTKCCETKQWNVAYALVNQTPKNNSLVQRFMAYEALTGIPT